MVRPPYSTRTLRYVRARAAAAMLGSVTILRRRVTEHDPATLLYTTAVAETVYTGRARIYSTQGGAPLYVGESVIATVATTVSLPYEVEGVHSDDIVVVDSFGTDPELEADAFVVTDVGGGGLLRATRQLSCRAYEASRWWE